MPSSNTISGGILIGSAVALASFVIGAGGTWMLTKNEPPTVVVNPVDLNAEILRKVRIDAGASKDPEGSKLSFDWQLNGLPIEQGQAGQCTRTASEGLLECRFTAPGTHAVSVIAIDKQGSVGRASSIITVTVPGGYVGLFINTQDKATRRLVEGVLLSAVDWPHVRAAIEKPILLNDPNGLGIIYAMSTVKDVEKAGYLLAAAGFPEGTLDVEIIMSRIPAEAVRIITEDMAAVGVDVVFTQVSYLNSTDDNADGGIGLFDGPGSFKSFVEGQNAAN